MEEKSKSFLTKAYYFALFVLMPLAFHDGYLDILLTKIYLYYAVAAFLFIGVLVDIRWSEFHPRDLLKRENYNLMDLCVGVFCLATILATIFSDYRENAFWGDKAYYLGCLMILVVGIYYFLMSAFAAFGVFLHKFLYFTAWVVLAVGILTRFNIFQLPGYWDDVYATYFTSTIGNYDTFYGLVGMLILYFTAYWALTADIRQKIALSVLLWLGYLSLWIAAANGGFLSLYVGFFFLVCLAVADRRFLESLLFQGILFGAAGIATELLLKVATPFGLGVDAIPLMLMEYHVGLFMFFGFLVLYVVMIRWCPDRAAKVSAGAGIVAMITVFALIVRHIIKNPYLFGGRYDIWYDTLLCFDKGSLFRKIFGIGPSCLDLVMDDFGIQRRLGAVLYQTAHNEPLDFIICIGIVGAEAFVGILFFAFRDTVILLREDGMDAIMKQIVLCSAAAIAAYVGLGISTGSVPTTYNVFFGLLVFIRAAVRSRAKEKTD